ncbi:Taf10p [Rhodotorula paludigena]|uniref:Taf10p n=1 Tax=Rhodotorula paludigena TaxID=86838 RepID=UPI00316C7846
MNPNDLFLRSHAHAQQQAQQQQQQQAQASTSAGATPAIDLTLDQPGEDALLAAAAQAQQGRSHKEMEHEQSDLELSQLLELMDDYKPIIPDEVTDFYLQRAGFDTHDVRVKRLLALAAQRFISSIASDSFQYARARTAGGSGGRAAQGKEGGAAGGAQGAGGQAGGAAPKAKGRQRTVLTMEDLSAALKEFGVDASRAPYYL